MTPDLFDLMPEDRMLCDELGCTEWASTRVKWLGGDRYFCEKHRNELEERWARYIALEERSYLD